MKVTGFLFLATLFCVTWEKVQWGFGVDVSISDLLTILFLVSFALEWFARGERRFPRTTAIVLLIFAALLVIYLVGFFNIQTRDSLDQWLKGMVKFFLHFLFLAAGVAYLARRSRAFYWQSFGALTLGLVANGIYGVLQLLAARAGVNLDNRVLSPLTGGASSINIYGYVNGATIFRPNALTTSRSCSAFPCSPCCRSTYASSAATGCASRSRSCSCSSSSCSSRRSRGAGCSGSSSGC